MIGSLKPEKRSNIRRCWTMVSNEVIEGCGQTRTDPSKDFVGSSLPPTAKAIKSKRFYRDGEECVTA